MDINLTIETLLARLTRVDDELIEGVGCKSWCERGDVFVNYGTFLRDIEYENTRLYCINNISRNFYDMSDVDIHYFSRQSNTWAQDVFT